MPEPALEPAADFLARQAVAEDAAVAPFARRGRLRRVLRRARAIIVALAVLFPVSLAIFGPALAPYDPVRPDPANESLPRSAAHLRGTGDLGRHVLSRVMAGTRYALLAVAVVLSLALLVGTV